MDNVYCPYCGKEMRLINQYPSAGFCFYCECGAASPEGETTEEAYAAAMRRLQKPLTLEEALLRYRVSLELMENEIVFDAEIKRDKTFIKYDIAWRSSGISKAYLESCDYNKTWRCWATRPSEEERSAAAWE